MALAWKAGWVHSPRGFESRILRQSAFVCGSRSWRAGAASRTNGASPRRQPQAVEHLAQPVPAGHRLRAGQPLEHPAGPAAVRQPVALVVRREAGVVAGDVGVGGLGVVRSWWTTAACGSRGLMPALSVGSGKPTARPKVATACGGRPQLGGDLVGVVADRADEDGAEPERLGRDDRVLGGEGGVDEADDRRLEVVRGVDGASRPGRPAGGPGSGRRPRPGGRGASSMNRWPAAYVASRAFRSGSRTTTTLQGCRFDDVGADWAAATIACRWSSVTSPGANLRTDRCASWRSSTSLRASRVRRRRRSGR